MTSNAYRLVGALSIFLLLSTGQPIVRGTESVRPEKEKLTLRSFEQATETPDFDESEKRIASRAGLAFDHQEVLRGVEAVTRERYAVAQEIFQKIIVRDTASPVGYFFLAAALHAQMIDLEDRELEQPFEKNLNKAIAIAKKQILENPDEADLPRSAVEREGGERAWLHLILGNAYGYLAVFQARKGELYAGIKSGMRAKGNYEKALKVNPHLYDAYMGLGNYHFWKSVKTRRWHWLPFFRDEREKGIRELVNAMHKGEFSRVAAALSLIYVYIHEHRFADAVALADSLGKEYPENKGFLWGKAAAHYENYQWTKASAVYRELASRLEKQPQKNFFNLIECQYRIAQCQYNSGKYKDCIRTCRTILNYPLTKNVKKRQESKLKKTQTLLEKAEKITGKRK